MRPLYVDGVLAGGCDSPVRSGWSIGAPMFVQAGAEGPYALDAAGRRYIDYVMAYGPLLFGHTDPALTTDLDAIAANGLVWGNTHHEEVRLAERIRAYLPSLEKMRFVTTGTEAVMSAVRVARAYVQRQLVLRFAGNYHGHFDLALIGAGASAHTSSGASAGIPNGVTRDVALARYNDLDSVDAALRGREAELAAILVEPICANMGLVWPQDGFLQGLRERADAYGACLIFDEVISWPRFGLHGAQGRLGVRPDLTTLGKVLGGGSPIAAFGGHAALMDRLAPAGNVFSGGTHGGNPFGVAMAHRVLDRIEGDPGCYAAMDALAQRLAAGIRTALARRAMPYAVVQSESVVDFKFRAGCPTRNFDDARAADVTLYAAYYRAMLQVGVLLPPSQNEVMFLSTAHAQRDVDATIEAIGTALDAVERYRRTAVG